MRVTDSVCSHPSAFDLVNIHLFHDASNLVAWERSPSVYSGTRQKALGYVLDRYCKLQPPLRLFLDCLSFLYTLLDQGKPLAFCHSILPVRIWP